MTLPTFVVRGAPTSVMTSVHSYLAASQDVYMSLVEELDFFREYYDRGLDWYAGLFEGRTDEKDIGEASLGTLASPEAVGRVRAVAPEVRFVSVLGDPVEWAHSQCLYAVDWGTQSAATSFSAREWPLTTDRQARPQISDANQRYLACLYAESNRRLKSSLGWDPPSWTSP